MLTLRAYEFMTLENWNNDYENIWLPDFTHFRQSDEFKQWAAELGMVDYWREHGFPPPCEAVGGENDFACS